MAMKETKIGYTKQQFLNSETFQNKKDLVNALLVDGRMYTVDGVNKLINDFLKKEAK